ncbi:D-aminoacyl-tRNA deacylase-like [Branchiostoma floridae]|uniref:D-aminoacyl-tRNA deacylase n=2 Tax=Branchiostoma floridae TaxID=7739 RepID=A0A9J7L2K8_BRAFL|nr:D-aminoacyl-tRNA deacylase-like [Branchiostoma floridae]
MRAVVQRVMQASVSVGDELVSSIGRGLCVLIGVSRDDSPKDMEYIVRKILNLRVFDDDQEKRWAHSVKDKNYEILCVSQFTLYCVLKGNKPDFHQSMAAEQSQAFYEEFLQQMRKAYQPDKIKDGRFGAYMQVSIQNDGPVTVQLESPVQQQKSKPEKTKAARQQKWEKKAGAGTAQEPATAQEPVDVKMEQVTEQLSQTSTT